MKQLGLYVRTLAYLRPSQVAYFLWRRIFPQSRSIAKTVGVKPRLGISMVSGISVPNSTGCDSQFCFLGQSKRVQSRNGDWACKDMPKLWRYNLHYFDYLHDPQRSFENKCFLITDWIQHNPPGTEDAWEPYTVSLRIVNWIKFFLLSNEANQEGGNEKLPRREWIESLCQQALWLEQHIEYHILANHYLKNGAVDETLLRRHDRKGTKGAARFTRASGEIVICEVLDLSLGGVSLATDVRPQIGEIVLIGQMAGRVARIHENGIAIEFVTPPPEKAADPQQPVKISALR